MSGLITPYGIRHVKKGCVGVVALCGVGVLYLRWKKRNNLRKKAVELKKSEAAAIQAKLNELDDEDTDERKVILSLDAQSLIFAVQERKISPQKALNAYLYQACSETQRLNCVTSLIKTAHNDASNLKDNGKPETKMLFGLPISLKESLETKGMDSTVGFAANIGHPATEDCVLAKVLKHCGAIPFVKTNLSQMMCSFESSNPIFGATLNPQNVKFTPGGSSSGEGALVGCGGSLLGFGTDTAGSIRCPSHMCGIAGFKPSQNRISTKGLKGLWGQIGPMARDVDTLVLAMRALLCPLMFELDVNVPPLPFNEEEFGSMKKLRIGYYVDDGYNEPAPAIKRSVLLAKEALEKAGHTLVTFQPPRIGDMMRIFVLIQLGDGDLTVFENIKNEEIDPVLNVLIKKWSLSRMARCILSTIVGMKYPRLGQDICIHGGGDRSVTRLRKLEGKVEAYKQEFHDAWKEKGLDAVICPPFPVVGCPLGSLSDGSPLFNYTGLYNLLHYPAGVVPMTKVTEEDVKALKNFKGHYDDLWDRNNKSISEGSLGVSVGVQCVALPFQDEVCLRVMKEVESMLVC